MLKNGPRNFLLVFSKSYNKFLQRGIFLWIITDLAFLWSWSLSFMGRAADILEAAAAC